MELTDWSDGLGLVLISQKAFFSIYVGAPLQQHSDGSRGAIHFSDYDTIDHRWIFPEQIPHKHFRRVSLAGNHVINITTNFIGHIVKVSANEKRAFYTCDSQLQSNLKCDPLGTCYALSVSEPSVSESQRISLLGKGLTVAYTVYCILIYQIECQLNWPLN